MTTSTVGPAVPDNNVAVGYLVAEALNKSNAADKAGADSQKDIDEQFMKQNITDAIQGIMGSTRDHLAALALVKNFLSGLNANASSWGSEIQNWIARQLDKVNSYSTPQALLNALKKDGYVVQQNEKWHQDDIDNYNACESKKEELEATLQTLENKLDQSPWYEQAGYALAIAGVAVALGAVDLAVAVCQSLKDDGQKTLSKAQTAVNNDKLAIENDPGLVGILRTLDADANFQGSNAGEKIADYRAAQNVLLGFLSAVDGVSKGFAPASNE